jgi:hypothetical protein
MSKENKIHPDFYMAALPELLEVKKSANVPA